MKPHQCAPALTVPPSGGARAAGTGNAHPPVPAATIIDVPVPPSVNKTRRINWAGQAAVKAWKKEADALVTLSGQYRAAWRNIARYELTIVLDESRCRLDPDNPIKTAIDYLRRLEIIQNDSPRHARKITIEWGTAPQGCRLIVKPLGGR